MTTNNNSKSRRTMTIAAAVAASVFAVSGVAQAGIDPDINKSGSVGLEDLSAYLTLYLAGDKAAEVDDNGQITIQDLFYFIETWIEAYNQPTTPTTPKDDPTKTDDRTTDARPTA